MRALKKKKRSLTAQKKFVPACMICKKKECVDDFVVREMKCTRSFTKFLESMKEFIIIEIYRCMPLLGNELDNAPDWDVHIVRYAVIFTNIR